MASIPAPYAIADDASVQDWWAGLPRRSRVALMRSWSEDECADPLHRVARRTAQYLNEWMDEHEQPRDPIARELHRRGLARGCVDAEPAGWDWGVHDRYEYRIAHADLLDVRLDRACYSQDALPQTRMMREPTLGDVLASGSWWAL